MSLGRFLSALFADGRVSVGESVALDETDVEGADRLLADEERRWRDEMPGAAPAYCGQAARHGAIVLYRACQFVVFRDMEADFIGQELDRDVGQRLSPSVHYSVDLTLRFLPDVVRLARGRSEEDPLVGHLIRLAGKWPLSAVGIEGAMEHEVATLVEDGCLLRLYADRIVAARGRAATGERAGSGGVSCGHRCVFRVGPRRGRGIGYRCGGERKWRRVMSEEARDVYLPLARRLVDEVLQPVKSAFVGKDEIIDLMGVCLVAGENLFLHGPPGTAKSALVQELARRIDGRVFDYLLTRFTEPNEIFGPFDIRKLRDGELVTNTEGMLPEASLVFLDELLNANSAILNSLLNVLNERVFGAGARRGECRR